MRNFAEFIELSPQSSGIMYGGQIDFGFSWPATDRGREQSILITWCISSTRFYGVLKRTIEEKVELIDADSSQNSFSVSLRSTFK